MNLRTFDARRRLPLVLILVTVALLASVARLSLNADRPYLWFDEAGQYFVAKGLNHDSAPLATAQGLAQVIENNRHYNRDPGGFSVILHAWSAFGDGHIWLRGLPFALYLLAIAVLVRLIHLWTDDLPAALLAGMLPMFSRIEQFAAFELRAYSMEMLGTVTGLLMIEWLRKRLSWPRLLLASCLLSLFVTSRYSAVLVMFVVTIMGLYLIVSDRADRTTTATRVVAWCLPLGLSVVAVYCVSMAYQNATARPLFYLPYLSNDPGLVLRPKNMLFLGLLALLAVSLFAQRRLAYVRTVSPLLWVLLMTNAVFMLASTLGMHPWDPFSDRCISLHWLLVILSGVALAGVLSHVRERPLVRGALFIAVLVVMALNAPRLSFKDPPVANVYQVLASGMISPGSRLYVDRSESPSIRYLFEKGALRDDHRFDYPSQFTFGRFRKHSDWAAGGDAYSIEEYYRDQPKMNDLHGYDVLVTPELFRFGHHDRWQPLRGADRFFVPATELR